MGKITKIEQQKNKDRVNIFVDESFFCGMGKETAILFGIRVGRELDEKKLLEAANESEVKRAFDKSADYLASRMHSKFELIQKLMKKGFERDVCESAVKKLEDYGYVDDGMFAKMFVQSNPRYSKLMLEQKLKQKGVAKKDIDNAICDVLDEDEFEKCLKLAKKYASCHDLTTKEGQQKLFSSLLRRGFNFEMVKKACKRVCESDDFYDENI